MDQKYFNLIEIMLTLHVTKISTSLFVLVKCGGVCVGGVGWWAYVCV